MYKLQLDTQNITKNCIQNLSELSDYLLNKINNFNSKNSSNL